MIKYVLTSNIKNIKLYISHSKGGKYEQIGYYAHQRTI